MKKVVVIILSCFLILGAILSGVYFIQKPEHQMSYPTFLEAVQQHKVSDAILPENSNTFEVILKDQPNIKYTVPNPKTEDFIEYLLIHDISVKYRGDDTSKAMQSILIVSIIGGIFWYSRKGSNSNPLIKNANKKKISLIKAKTSLIPRGTENPLAQVAGNVEAKSMVEDIIQFIKSQINMLP